ncbi:MAG: redoxin family protein [Prosthecobacter sp.]|nr:redoxin family protein [Prosthecobacter sp.]
MKIIVPFFLLLAAGPLAAQVGVIEEKFKGFDKNSDGVISGEELNAESYLRKLDLDGNGELTLAESIKALRGKRVVPETTPGGSGDGLFDQLDKNHDGRLTVEELPKKQWFAQLDLDKSGDVTLDEAKTAMAKLRRGGEIVPGGTTVKPATEDPALKEAPEILKGSEYGVGHLVSDLTLKTIGGTEQPLSARLNGNEGLVIAFFGATCPISNKLGAELARLERECLEKRVRFLLVCPVATETAAEIDKFISSHGLKSPVVHDQDSRLTATLAATTTTEVFLIDASRTLVYRGAINDQYGLGYSKESPTKTYLRDAVTAMLRQQVPAIAATTAPGCTLDKPQSVAAAPVPVTYHHQVERILQNHCIECHRQGGVGPFSLDTYEDVIEHAGMIRKQVDRGAMPPWFAAPFEGQAHSPWINDVSLSLQDKADLLNWLASNRPRGDAADAPRPVRFPEEWGIGEPDAIVQLPQPISIKAEGTMPYQFVTVATTFSEDRWVRGYEIQPTDRAVVHHVIVQVHPKGEKITNRGEGNEGYWAAYVPGNGSHLWPAGFAKKLPAGSTVSFQIHYTPNGKRTEDQLRMGLVFAKDTPRYVVHTAAVPNPRLNIPPGEANHVEVAERPVPGDMNVLAYMAHMHVRGKAFKFEVTYPDGKNELLLDIPKYDFNWQLRYDYAQPHFLPQGSRVKVTAVYDNSEGNPANPDPTKNVRWGQQTFDEMMIGYIEYYTPYVAGVAGL